MNKHDKIRRQFEEWIANQKDWFPNGIPELSEGELVWRAWKACAEAMTESRFTADVCNHD